MDFWYAKTIRSINKQNFIDLLLFGKQIKAAADENDCAEYLIVSLRRGLFFYCLNTQKHLF